MQAPSPSPQTRERIPPIAIMRPNQRRPAARLPSHRPQSEPPPSARSHDHTILVFPALPRRKRRVLALVLVPVQHRPWPARRDERGVLWATQSLGCALVALLRRTLVPLYRPAGAGKRRRRSASVSGRRTACMRIRVMSATQSIGQGRRLIGARLNIARSTLP